MINGDAVKRAVSSYSTIFSLNSFVIVLLSPGVHSISAKYHDDRTDGNTRTIKSSQFMTINHEFTAGRHYYIFCEKNGSNVSLRIVDETDPSIWTAESMQKSAKRRIEKANKKINNASFPKNPVLSIAYEPRKNDALESAPTPFEGTWISSSEGTWRSFDWSLTFQGKFYTKNDRLISTSEKWDFRESGVFDFTNDTITFTTFTKTKFRRGEKMPHNIKEKTTVYNYTLNDGNLVLLNKRNKPVATYVTLDGPQ